MVTVFFRRGSYYARVFTPADLRGILRRQEFQRSLGTKSYREAKIKAGTWSGRVAALFVRLRMSSNDIIERISEKRLRGGYRDRYYSHPVKLWATLLQTVRYTNQTSGEVCLGRSIVLHKTIS